MNKKIDLKNGKQIVVEYNNYDNQHPDFCIYLQKNGIAVQDICVIRPEDTDNINENIECLIWGDEKSEDYTHKIIINQYQEEDDV